MKLAEVLETAGVGDRVIVNCDWVSPRSLKIRGSAGRTVEFAGLDGPWLVPGTWWSQDRGLTVFGIAEWPGTGAVAHVSRSDQGTTLTWLEDGASLIILIPTRFRVESVKATDLWYPRLPRIGGQLPDFPVKQAFVQIFGDRNDSGWSGTQWTATTTNGVRLQKAWSGDEIESIDGQNPLIAVWPPVDVPGWKLYSILMQGLPVVEADRMLDGHFTASICVGTSNVASTFVDASQEEIRPVAGRPDVIGLLSDRGGPRVLFLRDRLGNCGGGIRLLSENGARGGGDSEVAVDFGTSHSATCWADGNDLTSTLAAKGSTRGWNYPAIVRKTNALSFDTPWLLGYPALMFEKEQQGEITFIPSGLFLRAIEPGVTADSVTDWRQKLPFVDYCLMGPSIDFETRSDYAMRSWRAGLKWADDDNAAHAFLTALLLWITAERKGDGATLRFSFPHAFPEPRRKKFGELLDTVAKRVSELTGSQFRLATPCFTARDARSRPFVDEATPVISEVMDTSVTRFLHLNAPNRQAVLVADLGGGTLDLLFAVVDASGHSRDFRLVASESVQFGAKAVLELIMEKVAWQFPNPESVPAKLKEALLEQWTRSGELVETVLATARTVNAETGFVRKQTAQWRGQPKVSAQAILEQVCIYFFLVREYCARFAGGVLTSPELEERMTASPQGGSSGVAGGRDTSMNPRAPGRGSIDWKGEKPLDLAIALTGNGWRFLDLAGFDSLYDQTRIESEFRKSVRSRIAEYAGIGDIGEISLDGIAAHPKLITSQGMLRLDGNLGEGWRTVEVAPNGCTDTVSQAKKPWGSFVSPADAIYDLPPQQILEQLDPRLAPPSDSWFTACVAAKGAARKYQEKDWNALSTNEWNAITKRQGSASGTREISTDRALWETVVRGYLHLSSIG